MGLKANIVAQIAQRIADTPHGARGSLIRAEAARHNVSYSTLYRALANVRPTQRRPRRDRGALRKVANEHVAAVAQVKAKCHDPLANRNLPTDIAITIAETNGLVPPGAITPSAYNRIARARALHGPKRLHTPWQAQASNELHQLDSTQSKYLRVIGADDDGQILIGVRLPEYRRKRQDEPIGLWATGVIDDCSRVIHIVYSIGAGESCAMVIAALQSAWSADPRCPLRGLPKAVLCDFGPFKKSKEGPHFLESIGVALEDSMPNTPWVRGKIERPWRTLISRFELPFTAAPDTRLTLSDLNARLLSHCAAENQRRHPHWKDATREQIYAQKLDASTVRYLPEEIGAAIWRDDWRRVRDDATISYQNALYLVPDQLARRTVRVIVGADGAMAVESAGDVFPVKPFAPIAAGSYRAHHDTPAMRAQKAAASMTYKLPDLPESKIVRLPLGEAARVESPLARLEDEPEFANQDEALRFICVETRRPLHEWTPDVLAEIKRLVTATLNKETLRQAAAELRTLVG